MNKNKSQFDIKNIKIGFNIIMAYFKQATIGELEKIRGQLNQIIKKKKEFKRVYHN